MGSLTEGFASLSDFLRAPQQTAAPTASGAPGRRMSAERLTRHLLRPLLPAAVRLGPGSVLDLGDRQVGPFDNVACQDAYPAFGDEGAAQYLADGVIFALNARDWAAEALSDFASWSRQLKGLTRRKPQPIFAAAVSLDPMALDQLGDFLRGPEGASVDAVLCIGHHLIVRNDRGLYGPPERVPFVTQRDPAQALKAFAFLLLELTQGALGRPFELADYQHL
jgi:hypothetical protein